MSLSKIRENARVALTGKWGKGALIVLAYLAFYFAFGFVDGLLGEPAFMDIVSIIIDVPLSFGLIYAFIKLIKNEDIKSFDFVRLGFSNFGRAWRINLTTLLKLILKIIVYIVGIYLISMSIASGVIGVMAGYTGESSIGVMILGCVVMIVALVWLIIKSLLYSLTIYIAYDNPEMTAFELVDESARLMKGNRGKLFLLELSFIGWAILAVFTLGIGVLWLFPYMQVAFICFYEYLTGKRNDDNTDLT